MNVRTGVRGQMEISLVLVGHLSSVYNHAMRAHLCTAYVLLGCSRVAALIPGANFFGSRSRMAEVRSGLRQRVVPSSGDKDKHAGIGSLFWKRTTKETTRRGTGLDAGAEAAAPPMPASTTSSVIHLGKLRIPQSRRLSLTATSARGGNADMSVPVSLSWHERDAALRAARETLGVEEHEAERGRLIEIGGNRTVVPPQFIGGPSVIPFGVGEGKVESGVVQVPLRYTVGQTVDFIRTVATVDRDYSRTATAASASFYRAQEGSTLSSRIYVTENGVLKGYITMATLLTHQPETSVRDLVRELDELLREGDSWEDAAHRLRQANVMAAPVVDEEGVLVAVLNPADLLQEMEIEATDDIMRQSGSGGGESYFGTPLTRLVASRVGWLVSLLCLQSFSSLILQSFQTVIEKNMVIALFLTMLTGTAGNAGNQSSAIVIRGLATGEIRKGNRMRVVWREARAAVASAFVLSIASFVRVMLTPGATTVSTLAVAIAMGATVIGAVMFGTIAPILLDKLGVDPVNFASPALATLTDVSGVFILCSVAKLMLGRA